MKKIISSVLLAGLFLGGVSPVFAESGESTQHTDLSSTIAATYEVSIPADLSIDLTSEEQDNATGTVELNSLTAAGEVTVAAVVQDLTTGSGLTNETLVTKIAVGDEGATTSSNFSLDNGSLTKEITVSTTDSSKDKLPGEYTGAINFTFDYAKATAQ